MILIPAKAPKWTQNYHFGWIGFVHHHSRLAEAIAWMTRWWRGPKQPFVSHVFIVSSQNTCLEAINAGVKETNLAQYFNHPRCTVYLRQPRGWTFQQGAAIVKEAAKYRDYDYDFALLGADAISYSIIGKILNDLCGDALDNLLTRIADDPRKMICDKLAVLAMQSRPELRSIGTLALPARENNPQRLFADDAIFEPHVTELKGSIA